MSTCIYLVIFIHWYQGHATGLGWATILHLECCLFQAAARWFEAILLYTHSQHFVKCFHAKLIVAIASTGRNHQDTHEHAKGMLLRTQHDALFWILCFGGQLHLDFHEVKSAMKVRLARVALMPTYANTWGSRIRSP